MAAMLNSQPIGMKFGMQESPTFAKKICKFVFFFVNFFLKAFLLYIYNTSDGKIFMTANSKKFWQLFQFVAINLKLSNFFVKIKFDCFASVMCDKIKRSFNTSSSQ